MALILSCTVKVKQQQQCTSHTSCPVRLEMQMCALAKKTIAGEVEWRRGTSALGNPYFVTDINGGRIILWPDNAMIGLGETQPEEYSVKSSCVEDAYKYLLDKTDADAAMRREKLLNDFLDSMDKK